MTRAKVRPTLADLEDRRKTAAEMAFARIEESIKSCPHDVAGNIWCLCKSDLEILAMAGRLEDCPNCNGKGKLYTHHAPGMPVEECADPDDCRNAGLIESDCPECILHCGMIIP